MPDSDHRHCDSSLSSTMYDYQWHQLLLASSQARCGDSCARLMKVLQPELLNHVLDKLLGEPTCLPYYLTRPAANHALSHLMALESLLPNNCQTKLIFDTIVKVYYPDNVKTFFETFTLNIQDHTHRQKFWENVCSAMERRLHFHLSWLNRVSGSRKQRLRALQKTFSDLIEAMAIPLHDDKVPTIQYCSEYTSNHEHYPLFTTAVELKLAPEALLLYDTGAVGNKELRLLAENSDVQKMLKSEEDNSTLAVFLRKVLNKPRTLQCLAAMQVSRLLCCHAPGDKEKRVRGLGLLDIHVEQVLLRRQCGRYRAALKQADDEDKAGAS